jgi:hypothetical protein
MLAMSAAGLAMSPDILPYRSNSFTRSFPLLQWRNQMGRLEMKLDENSFVAGQLAPKVRELMRYFGRWRCPITNDLAVEQLDVSADIAREFITGMLDAGFLEPYKHPISKTECPGKYWPTRTGVQIGAALFIKRLDRVKADRIVADLLDRADAINANPDLLYQIASIDAFGSYITDTNDIGDVDIVANLEYKKEKRKHRRRQPSAGSGVLQTLYDNFRRI